jgi:uroporphyrinogen decarboxylase
MTEFNSSFLEAFKGNKPNRIPVWFMRQAGRYQPEYREIRKSYSLVEVCKNPRICADVTLLPVKQLDADAAILFSDIMIPLIQMNIDFEIKEGIGPVIANPFATTNDLDSVHEIESFEKIEFVGEATRILKSELTVPLIGFCGAPFTLASYIIEGGPSKNYYKTKAMMYNQPFLWESLMKRLAISMGRYLRYQLENGASAIQIFDSWVGSLSVSDYKTYIYPYMQLLFEELQSFDVPKILFGVNCNHLLSLQKESGANGIGLDWRGSFKEARQLLGLEITLQGNLDPALLLADWYIIEKQIDRILEEKLDHRFIFNLGHGIMPQASIDTLRKISDYVHSKSN